MSEVSQATRNWVRNHEMGAWFQQSQYARRLRDAEEKADRLYAQQGMMERFWTSRVTELEKKIEGFQQEVKYLHERITALQQQEERNEWRHELRQAQKVPRD